MAKSFQHIGPAAIKVLARLEARKAAKEQFRQQGIKTYRHVELLRQASEYLSFDLRSNDATGLPNSPFKHR
jgi:hypothetical protein